uniref:Uncharacterized protein n=1 Tax=Anguilla anguilla TaxID=7936 RepID=A0A0E9XJU0_ANGAN
MLLFDVHILCKAISGKTLFRYSHENLKLITAYSEYFAKLVYYNDKVTVWCTS